MTKEQKIKIAKLRDMGMSFAKIGESLGLSKDTVKSYCRRNNIKADAEESICTCKNCGKVIEQKIKTKRKKFCSKECRLNWWHSHPEQIHQKSVYVFTCAYCGAKFQSYGNKHRKYCSHDCYVKARFKGGERHE